MAVSYEDGSNLEDNKIVQMTKEAVYVHRRAIEQGMQQQGTEQQVAHLKSIEKYLLPTKITNTFALEIPYQPNQNRPLTK